MPNGELRRKQKIYTHINTPVYRQTSRIVPLLLVTVFLSSIVFSLKPSAATAASTITMGETNLLGTRDSGNGNVLAAQQVTLTQQATLQSLSFYVSKTGGKLRVGVYSDSGGNPQSLLVSAPELTPSAGWNTVNVSQVSLSPGTYWLAFLPESNNLKFLMDPSGPARWFSSPFGELPTRFTSNSIKSGSYHWSFYATLALSIPPSPTVASTTTLVPTSTSTSAPIVTSLPSATQTALSSRTPTLSPTNSPIPTQTATSLPSATQAPSQTPTTSAPTPVPSLPATLPPTTTLVPTATQTNQSTLTIGETGVLGTNDSGNGNLLVAQQVVLGQPATLQSLSFYVNSASGKLQLGIYDTSSGSPRSLLASSSIFTPVSGWNTVSVPATSLAAGTYWLAYLPESSSLSFPMNPSGPARWFSPAFGSMPGTFSTASNSGIYHWSFYATLNTNGGPTVVPTATQSPQPTSPVTATPVPSSSPTPLPTSTGTAPTSGMLRVDPANPRYFTDGSGNAILLVGDHTWNTLIDNGPSDPPPAFDYTGFLNSLQTNGINFFRMFVWEQAKWSEGTSTPIYYSPSPFLRTGPGTALDGKPKFDLTRFNQAYFDRLRQRVQEANQKGIYVSIQLFDSFSVENKGYPSPSFNPWPGHPFNKANNVNNINGDTNNNGEGEDSETLADAAVTAVQDAYVKQVIDTVNDLNVLYEISNESDGGAAQVAWQNHMIDLIHGYEAGKAYQHPVGFTVPWPGGSNTDLLNSHADWISPNGDLNYPMLGTGNKVVINDTDHIAYPAGDRIWAWKSFTNGLNPAFMDPYDCQAEWSPAGCNPNNPIWVSLRRNLGWILNYSKRLNLEKVTPNPGLASSSYVLASPALGQYLVYLPSGGSVTVDLTGTSGTLNVEWFNPATGAATAAGTTPAGAKPSFTAPFGGDAVLFLHP